MATGITLAVHTTGYTGTQFSGLTNGLTVHGAGGTGSIIGNENDGLIGADGLRLQEIKENTMTRKTYHVTKKDDHWQGKLAGAERASVTAPTKVVAVAKTKELAKAAPLGQIKIHKESGQIQTEHTYGQDPRRYKS